MVILFYVMLKNTIHGDTPFNIDLQKVPSFFE